MDGAVPSEIAKNNLAYAEKSAENESENAKIAENESARSISGDFESGASSSGRSARTAIPSIPSSTTYTVSATSGNRTVEGEVNGNSFTIKLSSAANETWTVKAEGSDSSMEANTKILEGSTTVTLNANSVKNDISITLSPISSGNGTVSLPISVATDSGIQSAIVKIFEDAGETKQITVNTTLEYDFFTTKNATISANVTAGSRYFVFTFYSVDLTAAKQNPNQNIAYQAHEVVNVFQNLTTDTWQKNDTYLKDGQFLVTKALADTFNRKEFYVKGTGSTLPGTASDDNSGTYFDPFATIKKAVDTINAINDGTSAYTIKVDGTIEITSQSDSSAVIIQPTKPLTLTIEGVNASNKATVKANSNDMRVFIVGNGANTSITPNVTMKNMIITGGNNRTGGGAGIKLGAGNLTLSNVEVTGNSTTDVGGGICVEKDASLTINEGSKISNNSAENGGGIYVRRDSVASSGSLDVTNSEISENTATSNGGGIYVSNGNCTINGGTISNNSAESNGGGIFVDGGRCTINGGAISNNKAASKGGGVCVAVLGSSITITGTTTMSGNQLTGQQETGTAIFVSKGATAALSGNISITQGIAQGGALPTIYLEKGIPGSISSGGSGGSSAIPDAVLKLGGNIQIGNGNSTGIKMEKTFRDTANIKITSKLTSTQIINISYDDAQRDDNPIIESEESWQLTQEDCDKFIVTNGNSTYKLTYDGSKNQGICANAN